MYVMYVNILYCNMYIYIIYFKKKKHVITIVWAIVQIFHSYPAAWVTDGF